jgi:hypothetical protein
MNLFWKLLFRFVKLCFKARVKIELEARISAIITIEYVLHSQSRDPLC